jgi:tRNA U34 5-methylaminomethyl-2-thiouridine-forming methyltransferase MnmC
VTLLAAEQSVRRIHYTAVELYPLPDELVSQLNYCHLLAADEALFLRMHSHPWEKEFPLTDHFVLHKIHGDLRTVSLPGQYDLVYFDAFSADTQPEMWTPEIFGKIARVMTPGAILVTYAAKGSVRRALQQTGFRTERLPGPPGKREMIRAFWKDD